MSSKKISHLNTFGKSLSELINLSGTPVTIINEAGILKFERDIYICPLCLKNYYHLQNSKYIESVQFSVDHYPPKSVGGKQTVLVCKPCNDLYGRNIDYSLKEYLTSQAFLTKREDVSFPVKLAFNGVPGEYNVGTKWEKGIMVQDISFSKYPHVKKWMFDIKKEEWSFTMKMLMPSEKLIAKALLRTAYLFCFSNWGYDFALSYTGRRLVNILQGKEEHPLSNCGVFGDVSSKTLANGFYFLSDPKKNQSFQVVFEIGLPNQDIKTKVFVVIPGPLEEAWNNLQYFEGWIEKKKANPKIISIHSNCVDREYYTHYHYTWQELTKK